ncbi:hypothetical protein EDB80DRAFT_268569 [Ilyonectria destructans]|nr:hypothetical protein BKA56DRAFT_605738 [Ilyonectria sp. MPI-CAGE-AT-0026]KAH6976795.1 hypothetical protein EDB80DRAFT_268569 [Ilyonectria destructans]
MSSKFSHFASISDGSGADAEASMPAQFASANMDNLCFDENTALLCEPTPGASEASPGLPCRPWSPWCLADQPGLVGAVAFPAPQDVPPGQPNAVPVSYVNEYDYNANPLDYSTWVNPIVLPAPEPLSPPTGSPASSGWPRATPTETGYRRRNPHSDQHSPPQFTKIDSVPNCEASRRPRRDSEQPESHHDNNGVGSNGSNEHDDNKTSDQNDKNEGKNRGAPGLSPNHDDEQFQRIQLRNRIASNEFRIKKREGALSLQAEVQRLEGDNRVLTSNRAKLVQEGHYFKILLLQHAKCKCVLIQNYIAVEAQRYISGIQQGAFPGQGQLV